MSFERPVTKIPNKPLLPNVHIEGVSHPHEEARLQKEIERGFIEQNHPDLQEIKAAERPKTKEEVAIINFVDRASNALIERYGGPTINITPDQVHVLDKKRIPKSFEDAHGEFRSKSFGVVVKEQPGKYPLAATTFHEMLHAKSRISYTVKEAGKNLSSKRVGLRLAGKEGEGVFFQWINEAVTEELTIEFVRVCIELNKWEDEIKETVQLLKQQERENGLLPEEDLYFARKTKKERSWFGFGSPKKESLSKEDTIEYYSYSTERQALKALVHFIYELNKDNFKSEREVFDVFARAMISSTLLPLGRLIERTLPDSFRILGSLGDKNDLRELPEKLEKILRAKQAEQ